MSRSKQLWEAECEQVCRDYQDGKLTRKEAIEELQARGWPALTAEDELDEWKRS